MTLGLSVLTEVSFKAVVVGKSLGRLPSGEEIVRVEFAEDKPASPPIVMNTSRLEGSEVAREVLPVVSQVLSALPITRATVKVPRLTLVLTKDEWDSLEVKPELGEEVTVTVSHRKVSIGGF